MNRIWDERYNAGNVAAILAEGQFRPVRTHYPTLSYLPHALILKTWETAFVPTVIRTENIAAELGAAHRLRAVHQLARLLRTARVPDALSRLMGTQRTAGPLVAAAAAISSRIRPPFHLTVANATGPQIPKFLAGRPVIGYTPSWPVGFGQAPSLPDEARALMQTWRDAAEEGQRQFKNTVDGSFAAVTTYLDRLADGAPAEEPAGETEATE